MALVAKADFGAIAPQLGLLFLMTLITVPLGFAVLRLGYNRARISGSLAHY